MPNSEILQPDELPAELPLTPLELFIPAQNSTSETAQQTNQEIFVCIDACQATFKTAGLLMRHYKEVHIHIHEPVDGHAYNVQRIQQHWDKHRHKVRESKRPSLMSEERRTLTYKGQNERRIKKLASMTAKELESHREKVRESTRAYRAGLSEEKKQELAEKANQQRRSTYANLTEEQKEVKRKEKREQERVRRANMTEEQKANEKERMRTADLKRREKLKAQKAAKAE